MREMRNIAAAVDTLRQAIATQGLEVTTRTAEQVLEEEDGSFEALARPLQPGQEYAAQKALTQGHSTIVQSTIVLSRLGLAGEPLPGPGLSLTDLRRPGPRSSPPTTSGRKGLEGS